MLNSKKFFPLLFLLPSILGFTCSGSSGLAKTSLALQKAKEQPVSATQTASSMKGALRFRVDTMVTAFVDRMDENTVTVRFWDLEHEPKPRPAEEMKALEIVSQKDSLGDELAFPKLYIEIPGMTCPANDDPESRCNEPRLKIDAAFIEKIRKDGSFRARLGKMLGKEITIDKSNPVFKIEDVK